MIKNPVDLLFSKPIEFTRNVYIKIPTVEEAVYDENFFIYTRLFTLTTRELFGMARNVDELEAKFPTILSMTKDEDMDFALGKMMGKDYRGSALIMEALAYWTNLPTDEENGFRLISSGKIIHLGSEWIVDEGEWTRFAKTIQTIQCTQLTTDFTPPKPMNSDAKFNAWMSLLKGRKRKAERNSMTWADKILILSISMDAYIPINEIRKMPIYVFNRLSTGIDKKEAYEKNMQMIMSGKYETDKISKKHWKETFSDKQL